MGELPEDIANLTGSPQCLLDTMFLLNVQSRELSCTTVTLSYHGLEMQGSPGLVTALRHCASPSFVVSLRYDNCSIHVKVM